MLLLCRQTTDHGIYVNAAIIFKHLMFSLVRHVIDEIHLVSQALHVVASFLVHVKEHLLLVIVHVFQQFAQFTIVIILVWLQVREPFPFEHSHVNFIVITGSL